MVTVNSKRAGMSLAVWLALLLFVSIAGAKNKDKDKERGKNSPAHQSQKVSSDKKNQNHGRNRGSQQENGSQSSQTNRGESNSAAADKANPKFNKTVAAGSNRSPEFSRDGNFAGHDRGRGDFHSGPAQPHVAREAPRTVRQFGERQVAFDHAGHVRDIHARNMDIHRNLHGERTFVAEHNGVRIVSAGGRQGYVQRQYISSGGRVYVQRTYVVSGVTYARVYRSYYWHGAVFYHYTPAFYYHPAFYVWAYNPWPRPVYYSWGWRASPWYPAYGYYFAPYPVYPSAALWLTDYLIAENLRLSYEAQVNANAAAAAQYQQVPQGTYPQNAYPQNPDAPAQNGAPQDANTVQLSPEVKQMIADEVQRQLAAEKTAAGDTGAQAAAQVPAADANAEETPAALDPNHRVFVVASNLDVVADDGHECTLTPGDVILRTSNAPEGTKVAINVITSKQGDCAGNANAAVEVSDLQEMQNHFREQLDAGMKTLGDNQGKGGLPSAPDTGTVAGDVPAPTPDASAGNQLQDEQKAVDGVEGSVKTAAAQDPGNQP